MSTLSRIAVTGGIAVVALFGCSHSSNGPGPSMETGTVILSAAGRTIRVKVEVARTEEERARGLMYRRSLPQQQGMLFIFEQQQVQSFWMKNTYIPLDMIFIDQSLKVVGVVENAEPLTTVSRRVEAPSRYVLEVNGGFARQNSIGRGTGVAFEGVR